MEGSRLISTHVAAAGVAESVPRLLVHERHERSRNVYDESTVEVHLERFLINRTWPRLSLEDDELPSDVCLCDEANYAIVPDSKFANAYLTLKSSDESNWSILEYLFCSLNSCI